MPSRSYMKEPSQRLEDLRLVHIVHGVAERAVLRLVAQQLALVEEGFVVLGSNLIHERLFP